MAVEWRIDAVWDIECAEWDQFLCGALWTPHQGMRTFRSAGALADALMGLPPGAQTWAHAGGKYDVLWLIDYLACERGALPEAIVTCSGASATSVKFKNGPWLRDSARLIPMSLARAAKIAGPGRSKGDPGIPFDQFERKMPEHLMARIEEYMVGDVELLRDILFAVRDYAALEGIELRGTIGSTAWATAQKWCDLEDADWKADQYNTVREAYFGGLCAVGRTRADTIHRFDRKSAYPASLMEAVPIGEPLSLGEVQAGAAWQRSQAGAYHAIVNVPDSMAPTLPIRHRDRLAFPWGKIEGAWSHVELAYAISVGCTIEKFRGAVVWPEEAPIFSPYARKCFDLRDGLSKEKKEGLGALLKFLANSLTGKLGQSPESQVVVLGDYADDARYDQIGSSPWVWAKDTWRIPSCAMVQAALTLTARARVELYEQIAHAGDDWVYSDTDSCFATRPLSRRIGSELGEWAPEGIGRKWEAEAPKVYAYETEGEYVAHAKGLPGARDGDRVSIDTWRQFTSGEVVRSDRGVKSLKVAARGERLFQRRSLSRSYHANAEWCGARVRQPNDRTRAPHVTDLSRLR